MSSRESQERKKEEPLTSEEIETLRGEESWMPGNITFLNGYLDSRKDGELKPFLEYVRDHHVIEIGPGGHPLNKFVKCGSYIGVQPFEYHVPGIGAENYVIEDGLTYLRNLPDNSAVVVSFGVMDEDVLNYTPTSEASRKGLPSRYMKELAQEIRRVSTPFAIVVGSSVSHYMGEPDYAKSDWAGREGGFGGVYMCNLETTYKQCG